MGQVVCAVVHGSAGRVIGACSVGDGHPDPVWHRVDKWQRARELRREVTDAQLIAGQLVQFPEEVNIRRNKRRGLLGTAFLLGEERALEAVAENRGTIVVLRTVLFDGARNVAELVSWEGHGCRHKGGNSMVRLILGNGAEGVHGGVRAVSIQSAVQVQIHEAGDDVAVSGII